MLKISGRPLLPEMFFLIELNVMNGNAITIFRKICTIDKVSKSSQTELTISTCVSSLALHASAAVDNTSP